MLKNKGNRSSAIVTVFLKQAINEFLKRDINYTINHASAKGFSYFTSRRRTSSIKTFFSSIVEQTAQKIPITVIQANPGKIIQNKGYTQLQRI